MDIFKLRFMLAMLEQMLSPKTFLQSMFFKDTLPVPTDTIDIDIVKGKRRLAPMQNPIVEGKVVERAGFTTSTYKPAYIKPKTVTTAADLLKRLPGETLYGSSQTPEQRAAVIMAKDFQYLRELIVRRKEWMCAQALTTGKISIVGDGVSYEVDFLMDSNHKVTLTGADLWSAGTSDPLADLRDWKQLISKDSGLMPDVLLLGHDTWPAFINHSKVKDKLDLLNVQLGRINPANLPNGATYLGSLNELGVDVYAYDEWYLPDGSDTNTPMIPANKVVMGSTKARCEMHYAAIQDLECGRAAVMEFPKSWEEKDPSVRFVQLQSAPLAGLHQPDAFVVAQVLS